MGTILLRYSRMHQVQYCLQVWTFPFIFNPCLLSDSSVWIFRTYQVVYANGYKAVLCKDLRIGHGDGACCGLDGWRSIIDGFLCSRSHLLSPRDERLGIDPLLREELLHLFDSALRIQVPEEQVKDQRPDLFMEKTDSELYQS